MPNNKRAIDSPTFQARKNEGRGYLPQFSILERAVACLGNQANLGTQLDN